MPIFEDFAPPPRLRARYATGYYSYYFGLFKSFSFKNLYTSILFFFMRGPIWSESSPFGSF